MLGSPSLVLKGAASLIINDNILLSIIAYHDIGLSLSSGLPNFYLQPVCPLTKPKEVDDERYSYIATDASQSRDITFIQIFGQLLSEQ